MSPIWLVKVQPQVVTAKRSEPKAVCIMVTLLHLGIKNIRLEPFLPAFLSPNVLNYPIEHYGIAPVTTPEADLAELMK